MNTLIIILTGMLGFVTGWTSMRKGKELYQKHLEEATEAEKVQAWTFTPTLKQMLLLYSTIGGLLQGLLFVGTAYLTGFALLFPVSAILTQTGIATIGAGITSLWTISPFYTILLGFSASMLGTSLVDLANFDL